ncbi:hypothetical protein FB567DRAFT_532034 [Paraphoma chrysanthemicola]|uniref:Uncharacterized protein n=1 Tax=Paraphoma chrysanthemicola TaxID=798071 RepID=A0A8K0R2L3_9PLEO|nr:hypothetical protein FB567DRAFT_532034 [Paraphoma chrysanthemicola]
MYRIVWDRARLWRRWDVLAAALLRAWSRGRLGWWRMDGIIGHFRARWRRIRHIFAARWRRVRDVCTARRLARRLAGLRWWAGDGIVWNL